MTETPRPSSPKLQASTQLCATGFLAAGFLVFGLSTAPLGCTPPSVVRVAAAPPLGSSELRVARPGAPWPTSIERCVIPDEAQRDPCGVSIDILRSRTSRSPIARLDRRAYGEVRWSELPVLGDVPLAKVVVHGEGLTIDGWASLAGQEFYVRRAVALVPGHLWVPPGGRVSVLGTSGPTIAISVDTPFAAPRSVEALSSCDLFGARDETTRAAAGPPYAIPTGRGVALRSGPRGSVVFSFAPEATSLWVWLGSQGGYTHIAGGQPPWQVALGDTPLLFDGWVTDAEVRRTDQEPGDRDSGCGITDVNDQCPCDLPLHDAPFYVAALPGAEPIGTVAKGTALSLGEQRGELVAFTTVNRVVIPPPGQQFWIRREDARRAGVVPMSDGCPACP